MGRGRGRDWSPEDGGDGTLKESHAANPFPSQRDLLRSRVSVRAKLEIFVE